MNEFFGIRDAFFSFFHALRRGKNRRGKKFQEKRRAYFEESRDRSKEGWSLLKYPGFYGLSSFETRPFRPIKFQILFRRIFKDQVSLHL